MDEAVSRVGAGIALLRGAEVLLVRRGDTGLWDIPGGGSEADEQPETAARRELREETGLSVGLLRALGVFPHQHIYPDGNAVDGETHVFTAGFAGGEPQAADDASEVRWWPLSALPHEISEAPWAYFMALGHSLESAPR